MPSGSRRFQRLGRTRLLGLEVPVATSLTSRFLGLAFLDRHRAGPGLLIPRCRCIHTFGMRFPLDLLFLDASGRVIDLRRAVHPNRVAYCRAATAALELPSPEPGGGE